MLVSNNSSLKMQVRLDLLFDDGSEKHTEIKVGDKLVITYRRNYQKHENVGVVRDITIRSMMNNTAFIRRDNSKICLYLDFSDQYDSEVVCINTDDILDCDVIGEFDDVPEVIGKPFNVNGISAVDFAGVGIARIFDN